MATLTSQNKKETKAKVKAVPKVGKDKHYVNCEELKNAINETSIKYGIPYSEVEKLVLNEISKIFI